MLVLLLLLVFPVAGPGLSVAWAEVDPAVTKKQIKQVKRQIRNLEKRLRQHRKQLSAEERLLQDAERAVSEVLVEIRTTEQQQQASVDKLAQLQAQQAAVVDDIDRQQQAIASTLRGAYRGGRQEYLKLLLNQQSPQTMARHATYYQYLNRARLAKIEHFDASLVKLKQASEDVRQEQLALDNLTTELQGKQQQLQAKFDQRQQAWQALQKTIDSGSGELTALKKNQAKLTEMLQSIQEALSDVPTHLGFRPLQPLKGQLPWPHTGKLIHSFGASREAGKLHWNGVLIAAPKGSDVKAIHQGRVVFTDWMRGYGMLIILDHGDGFLSLYGNNQALTKKTGDWVAGGDVIAQSGNRNGEAANGIYFEIRRNGHPLDPVVWCQR